ncbi:DUF1449 domain-containing protein [Streptomyces sp. TR02-1]|uniref:DUF1449 domain-containing protein n=1 Tax=Streptomyces sp. TR02-1 TaxID=3385977 RepID=UPI0039A27C82
MGGFLRTAWEFPAVLFGSALVVVLGYWLFVLVGGVGADTLDGGGGIGADTPEAGAAGAWAALGLRGAPVPLGLSLLTVIAWFLSLVVAVTVPGTLLRTVAVPFVVSAAWVITRLLLRPLRHLARREEGVSHAEFVGRVCVIRTGRVDDRFGQAEAAAPDGASSLLQVRADEALAAGLTAGTRALIYAYDAEGGHFLVAPYDAP